MDFFSKYKVVCVVLSLEDFSTEADRLEEELCGIFLEVLLSCSIRIQIL
jgi:hypothetical protein